MTASGTCQLQLLSLEKTAAFKGRALVQPTDVSENLNQITKVKSDNTGAWRSLIIHKFSWVLREDFSGGSPGKNALCIKLCCL